MSGPGSELRSAVAAAWPRLVAMDAEATAWRPEPDAWCAREILGHLIDSAANNHPRFVRAFGEDHLDFPGYDGEAWVAAQHYRSLVWADLIALWRLYNLHLAHVMDGVPEDALRRPRSRHSLDRIAWQPVPVTEPATLDYMMRDYVGHMRHHLEQIFALDTGPGSGESPAAGCRIAIADALSHVPGPAGERFARAFAHASLDVEVYVPRGVDPQAPHTRDEVYVIHSGHGAFEYGGRREPFGPGDVLFVAAGVSHRFVDCTDDLVVWVFFYGPEGGEHGEDAGEGGG